MKYLVLKVGIVFIILTCLQSCKKGETPTVKTTAISNITVSSAISGGNVLFDGGEMVSIRGVCWGTNINPTINDNKTTDGAGEGAFTSSLTNLNPGIKYYIKAYATNKTGTGYGDTISLITLGKSPLATIAGASNITTTGVTLNGNVVSNYLSTIITFEYGTSINYGSTISAIPSPLTDSSPVFAILSTLSEATTYHYRLKAVNSLGTTYSNDLSFTTLGNLAVPSLQSATNISSAGATLNGLVNANYLSTVVTFEYGTTTSYGSMFTATQSPITGNTNKTVNAKISTLTSGTTYHFRLTATNKLGTVSTNDMTFNTLTTLTDIEGNIYNIQSIGTQIWMTENLRTTKYNNGDLIGTTTPSTLDIRPESTPKYQWAYEGNESNLIPYGRIYTWYVATDSRNVCPQGWHVPSDNDWVTLTNYLGGDNFAGGKLKETGISHWSSPNTGATNESGFSAVAGGNRWAEGSFHYMGWYGIYWSSSSYNTTDAKPRELMFDGQNVITYNYPKKDGFEIRCVKD